MKIYKYLPSEHFTKIFRGDAFVSLKATYPRDFNDPYELFLTVNTAHLEREELAYYQELLEEVPQWPTICFSGKPDVVPMWAHYARDFSGIVIELDEAKILKAFPEATLQSVGYSETPTVINAGDISYAYETAKPRHAILLRRTAFSAAYFLKSSHWSYELEKRFVIDKASVTNQNGLMFVQFPLDCIASIIVGPKMKQKLASKICELCNKKAIAFYRMHIGRSSMRSFFTDQEKQSFIFDGENLAKPEFSCTYCSEPLEHEEEECHWCAMSDADKRSAAARNPMRALAHFGLLKGY